MWEKTYNVITLPYRCFVWSVILSNMIIVIVLGIYVTRYCHRWILSKDNAGHLILNNLTSSFIFQVDDVAFKVCSAQHRQN